MITLCLEWIVLDNAVENNFWWSIELEVSAESGVAASEEALLTMADLSGSIGSELFEEEGKVVLRAAYRSSEPVDHWLSLLKALGAGYPGVRVRSHTKVENRSWHTDYLEAFPPLSVGVNLVVTAPWHKGKEQAGKLPLYIYPGSAFGTGYHESTQIALEFVERFVRKGDTIVDVGTGSGVLFIAALKLGAAGAVARDLDPVTIGEALRNMALNDLPYGLCDLAVGDLLKGVGVRADILTANILLEPNLQLLPDVRRVLKPGGFAVFSGMTVPERATFLAALPEAGLSLLAELTRGDWWGCTAGA